jgi:uncharacterized membrane protein
MRCFAKGDRKVVASLTVCLVPIYIIFGIVVLLFYPQDQSRVYIGTGTVIVIGLLIALHCYCIYIGSQTDDTSYYDKEEEWDGVRTYDSVE